LSFVVIASNRRGQAGFLLGELLEVGAVAMDRVSVEGGADRVGVALPLEEDELAVPGPAHGRRRVTAEARALHHGRNGEFLRLAEETGGEAETEQMPNFHR